MANINPNRESAQSQNKRILAHMMNGGTITSLEALPMFGCMRLASRITDLANKGHEINKEWITTESGKRVIRYSISNQMSNS